MEHGAPEARQLVMRAHITADGEPRPATAEQRTTLASLDSGHKSGKGGESLVQNYNIDTMVLATEFKLFAKAHPGEAQSIELAAAAYDPEGKMLASVKQSAAVTSGDEGKPMLHLVEPFAAPKGSAFLRIAVRNPSTNHVGTLEIPLPLAPEGAARSSIPAAGTATN